MRCSHTSQALAYKVVREKGNIPFSLQDIARALLRQLRSDAGLTQAQLAARLHRDQAFVSKYESGERRLDILELREVCRATETDFSRFIRRLDQELG
jgi:transcriptional regulator with XRE-family HTH domain